MSVVANNGKKLSSIPVGKTFKIGDLKFIVLGRRGNYTYAILKDYWKIDKFDDETNNFAESKILRELNGEFYWKIAKLIGCNNIIPQNIDLTSDDGRTDYESVYCNVGLLTCDDYRRYVYVLDKYRPGGWWWLATPYSTKSNGYLYAVRCVVNYGALNGDDCNCDGGVRPFCIFQSSISVS